MRRSEAALRVAGFLLCASLLSCMLLPIQSAPGATGIVVDAATGEPIEDAIVVLRFDGSYNDQLPDRQHIGHAETTTDPSGRFSVDRYSRAGITIWPYFHSEARVVSVLRNGYRCPTPIQISEDAGSLRIEMTEAFDREDQRSSCRPVAAKRGEAVAYSAAWRQLFPTGATRKERDRSRQLDRVLEARAELGFGRNCEGPVLDLSIAPDGNRAAIVAIGSEGPEVQILDLNAGADPRPRSVARETIDPPRRLAWSGPEELILWQPARAADRATFPSLFSKDQFQVVWASIPSLPAALAELDDRPPNATAVGARRRPILPGDLSDEADRRWHGRSFVVERALDPETAGVRERLRVTREDGRRYSIDLPGERCGSGGRFGRPQYRISADGRTGLDLRYVDNGCHAVRIDLETGDWDRIDASDSPGMCRGQRRIPPGALATALRGWTRDLESALDAAGADRGAAYSLRIEPNGKTQVRARAYDGSPVDLEFQTFPVATPLRRIDVTNVAPATRGSRVTPSANPASMEPL